MFPGLSINLNLGTEKGEGGTVGSVVNHVGFIIDNVQKRVAQWKAAGVDVLPDGNNRLDQAFVATPDACASKSWKTGCSRCLPFLGSYPPRGVRRRSLVSQQAHGIDPISLQACSSSVQTALEACPASPSRSRCGARSAIPGSLFPPELRSSPRA